MTATLQALVVSGSLPVVWIVVSICRVPHVKNLGKALAKLAGTILPSAQRNDVNIENRPMHSPYASSTFVRSIALRFQWRQIAA